MKTLFISTKPAILTSYILAIRISLRIINVDVEKNNFFASVILKNKISTRYVCILNFIKEKTRKLAFTLIQIPFY